VPVVLQDQPNTLFWWVWPEAAGGVSPDAFQQDLPTPTISNTHGRSRESNGKKSFR